MQQFSSTVNNNNSTNLHTVKMQSLDLNDSDATPPAEFDFQMPCRYFKSSFARSLSLNNAANHCKSLDLDTNTSTIAGPRDCPPLPLRLSSARTPTPPAINSNGLAKNEVIVCDKSVKPPAIPARRGSALDILSPHTQKHHQQQPQQLLTQFGHASTAAEMDNASNPNAVAAAARGNFNKVINKTYHHHQQRQLSDSNIGSSSNNNSHFRRNVVAWPRDNIEQVCNHYDEAEHEPTEASTLSYASITESHHPAPPPFEVPESTMNVEAVILQNQVDTLQWQLKQVETSCEMYRAVMEEVARFLERYHNQKQQQRQFQQNHNNMEQISRSKSLYHVYGGGDFDKTPPADEVRPASYLRARSSTNLIDLRQTTPTTTHSSIEAITLQNDRKLAADNHNYDVIAAANSYSAFKDFTWRRLPKKQHDCKTSNANNSSDNLEEKLNQEAYRLSRTIQNLLNTSTQQPDLTHHRNSLTSVGLGHLNKTSSPSIMTLHTPPIHNSTSLTMAATGSCTGNKTPSTAKSHAMATEILFLRSMNMRDSRVSLRSSTDSSVHSTTSSATSSSSSSKMETDEEATTPFHSPPILSSKKMQPLGSTTEDESGFSSISSFQDIGLPLSSTMITTASVGRPNAMEGRNSTLKPSPAAPIHPNNVVGVPLNQTPDMHHRWDVASPSKTSYRGGSSNKVQRFSTLSNEDSTSNVLWV